MPRHWIAIALTLCFSLVGCVTLCVDSRLVGTYVAKNSETLTILPNARVYHTRVVAGREQRDMIGFAVTASSDPANSVTIRMPDSSPCIGTVLQLGNDSRTLTVRWQNYRNPNDTALQ